MTDSARTGTVCIWNKRGKKSRITSVAESKFDAAYDLLIYPSQSYALRLQDGKTGKVYVFTTSEISKMTFKPDPGK